MKMRSFFMSDLIKVDEVTPIKIKRIWSKFSKFQGSNNSFLEVKWPENHENEVLFHVRPHQGGRHDNPVLEVDKAGQNNQFSSGSSDIFAYLYPWDNRYMSFS